MFFMVLDLRLVKIGCRETINFFVYMYHKLVFNRVLYRWSCFCVSLLLQTKKELKSYFELQLLQLRRLDSNERPPGYEPGELPTAPLRDVKFYKCLLLLFLVCECKVSMFCDNCQVILWIFLEKSLFRLDYICNCDIYIAESCIIF